MAEERPIKLWERNLPQNLTQAQLSFITQKTPAQYIKTRPGPGGIKLSYVEVGYVINMLNQVFGWDWDFKILDQQVGKKQVWVRGELTVRAGDHIITKAQYGGADIKINRTTQEPVSIADDLKAAGSDCLKKCASMIGIASDVYWKDLETQAPEGEQKPPQTTYASQQGKTSSAYSHKITT